MPTFVCIQSSGWLISSQSQEDTGVASEEWPVHLSRTAHVGEGARGEDLPAGCRLCAGPHPGQKVTLTFIVLSLPL